MFIRTNCDQKSPFSGILIDPLNPREFTVRKFQIEKQEYIYITEPFHLS